MTGFVAPNATVLGHVELGADASVWYGAVIRADNDLIALGEGTNVQDGCILHTDERLPMRIGARVTIGHAAVLHGCTVDDEALIGIGAVILNGARIGRHCIIGARSLVTEGKEIPERSLVMGSPARVVRAVTDAEIEGIRASAEHYVKKARATLSPR
jgi:carbonic anhydrase/acetyltransferase-like protein (isoleucine patch superfamily)